ncbi:TAF6-like RNA polymerase II p300/CBP-associated factor-associated factor 65 kDa subunit 6L [Dinothrombium tinctorium]|uniref:TAF6-like RNA polymerase II p300/CBP-associated factor-associated factor 65 kDa subunit 6L n=1 Tax=Dinothrombium tinctorium TaxID=1965070 RepID=A0A3S3Q361_9ACAR|nr:TAF6-like RNA polymerase II p300/CBP-associated factor-associated factor 65 kDa subunit 6L [Dinothrombium tinctorium]
MDENSGNGEKFIIFNPESIKAFAESSGVQSIDECVFILLAEDVSYRIREVVNNASQIMKHSKRKLLKTVDINKSLKRSDCKPVFGYSDKTPSTVVHIPEANLFCFDDREIDLLSTAVSIIENDYKIELKTNDHKLNVDWLSVEENVNDSLLETNVEINEEKDRSLLITQYYENIVKTILWGDSNTVSLALKELSSNSRVQRVVSHFINFISVGVKILNRDLEKLRRLMQTAAALFKNPYLYLYTEPYLILLTHSILFCIIEPLAASANLINDHWSLRESAAFLLSNVLSEWNSPFIATNVCNMMVNTLVECIKDISKPFSSHYGVIVAFKALGYEYIQEYLYPNLNHFWPHLTAALNSTDKALYQTKVDAQRVYGALCDVSVLFLQLTAHNTLNGCEDDFNLIYAQLSEYFGDSLSSCISSDCEKLRKLLSQKSRPKIITNLFLPPEGEQTGEELLDAFYETPCEESRSNSFGEEYNSEDDNSAESDAEKDRIAVDTNVLIKREFRFRFEHEVDETEKNKDQNFS